MMSYIDLNWDFSQFDRDNMNRYMAAAFAHSANVVAADILADPDAGRAADELAAADGLLGASRVAFRGHRYLAASFLAKRAYDLVRKGARQAGVAVVGSHDGWQVDEPGSARPPRPSSTTRPRSTTSARAATGCAAEPEAQRRGSPVRLYNDRAPRAGSAGSVMRPPKERAVLEDAVVRKVLGAALATGGEWAEVYAEDRLSHNIRLEDRRVEELVTGRDRGAGVRVVKGTASAYAYTNRLDLDALLEAARVAAAALREPPAAEVRDLRRRQPGVRHPVAVDPAGVERTTLAELVRRPTTPPGPRPGRRPGHGRLRRRPPAGPDRQLRGVLDLEDRVRTRFVVQVVAARDGVVQTGFDGPGRSMGFELLDEFPPRRWPARRPSGPWPCWPAGRPRPGRCRW